MATTPTVNSSLIGANLTLTGTTQLFALGTTVETTQGGHFEYVEATATQITGKFVLITPTSTAFGVLTSKLTSGTIGYDLGVFQNLISQGEFGWVAKKGRNLYVLCTGTITAGNSSEVGFGSGQSGILKSLPAVGNTLFGVWITTGISGATQTTTATLQWPRSVTHR